MYFGHKILLLVIGLVFLELLLRTTWSASMFPTVKPNSKTFVYLETLIQRGRGGKIKDIISITTPGTTTPRLAKCPTQPIVTVADFGGRFANRVWEYADVWGLSRLLGRPGYVPNSILKPLQKVFANLSLHSLEEISHCKLDLGGIIKHNDLEPLESLQNKYKGKNMRLNSWIFMPTLLLKFKNETKHEMRFKPEILREVEETVERVGGKGRVRVGIHVRRNEYDFALRRDFNTPLVGVSYFKMAIAWVRKNIPGPLIFLVVTDDLEWCREFLIDEKVKDVVIASKSIHHDLALLTTNAHNILDYGSYGHWGAFMTDGHTLSIDIENKKLHKEMMAITNKWHTYDIKDFKANEQAQNAATSATTKKDVTKNVQSKPASSTSKKPSSPVPR